ncbi:dUTP diphosphatase [Mycoplasma anatis]|uniref:dUTP diphosphatase n=1 Tax=Mycoplasmopsis anatis TaxID=171279 RepID=A0A9Q3L8K8_9BACT|nr:dUTP diphosphatase [Mycoplasmopsis anatis]MBW0595920.1 dUTP diphosphatase [Mycoplasmopsis anatis]MBW0597100.1 dUTP diphosphatase [Mycoplasmopsis anatis]MBW0597850.1 dUTP diphosphatase [Mycoplasmopsis anatis]MBW0600012.1 dUTP diphosphatase [Mycoplasmopsis anatis]MBW0600750.1 dUTP diphosphatase [Mycoplasmopsis anatis]
MNFTDIFNKQLELDRDLTQKALDLNPNFTKNDLEKRKLIALMVELGEFANEIETFKYWKKTRNLNRDFICEEFADLIHFLVSFGNDYNLPTTINSKIINNDINEQLIETFSAISQANNKINKEKILNIFELVLGLAELYGLEENEIAKWYEIKNKKNHERIKTNY